MRARNLLMVLVITLVSANLALGQQRGAPKSAPVQKILSVPENFPDVFKQLFEASNNDFDSIKGASLVGKDSPATKSSVPNKDTGVTAIRSHTFQWKSALSLPGASNCVVSQDEFQLLDVQGTVFGSQPQAGNLKCEFSNVEVTVIPLFIQAALGPGWQTKTEDKISHFFKVNENPLLSRIMVLTDGDNHLAIVGITGPFLLRKTTWSPSSPAGQQLAQLQSQLSELERERAANPYNNNDEVLVAIRRIESMPHSPLPAILPSSAGGPIRIQNDTSSTLTLYFSGGLTRRATVAAHSEFTLSLSPGRYEVAGELSDKSVKPFSGTRNYSGGEIEHFYVGQ
jgi:hypothetical protein